MSITKREIKASVNRKISCIHQIPGYKCVECTGLDLCEHKLLLMQCKKCEKLIQEMLEKIENVYIGFYTMACDLPMILKKDVKWETNKEIIDENKMPINLVPDLTIYLDELIVIVVISLENYTFINDRISPLEAAAEIAASKNKNVKLVEVNIYDSWFEAEDDACWIIFIDEVKKQISSNISFKGDTPLNILRSLCTLV